MIIIDASESIQEFESENHLVNSTKKPLAYVVDTGITHWIVAESMAEVKGFLIDQMDIEQSDIESCDISEIQIEGLKEYTFHGDNYICDMLEEFYRQVKKYPIPFELACTEY